MNEQMEEGRKSIPGDVYGLARFILNRCLMNVHKAQPFTLKKYSHHQRITQDQRKVINQLVARRVQKSFSRKFYLWILYLENFE